MSSYPERYRKHSVGSSGNSHAIRASPSDRTGSSSPGSKHALRRSSAHRGPCRPWSESGMTPPSKPTLRIDAEPSFVCLAYLNSWFRSSRTDERPSCGAISLRYRSASPVSQMRLLRWGWAPFSLRRARLDGLCRLMITLPSRMAEMFGGEPLEAIEAAFGSGPPDCADAETNGHMARTQPMRVRA